MFLGHSDEDVAKGIKDITEKAISFGVPTKLEVEIAKFLCDNIKTVEIIRMLN